jgi:hypothetical protein
LALRFIERELAELWAVADQADPAAVLEAFVTGRVLDDSSSVTVSLTTIFPILVLLLWVLSVGTAGGGVGGEIGVLFARLAPVLITTSPRAARALFSALVLVCSVPGTGRRDRLRELVRRVARPAGEQECQC